MVLEYATAKGASFSIPEEALKAGEFEVHAFDRDGHVSKRKKFWTLDRVVLEKNPN